MHPAWSLAGQAAAVLGLVLAVAVATLGGHPAPGAALEPQGFAFGVLPVLERAGCGDGACHDGARGGLVLRPWPARDDAARALALAAVRGYVTPGDPERSPLLRKVLGVSHGGATRLPSEGCEATALRRWVRGEPVPLCGRR